MDLALAMLVLWALLFVPIGFAVHGLVLGPAARVRALPLAPITGIAMALLVLSVLARLGVNAGDSWVIWAFVAASAASALVVWRAQIAWRSRELIGCSLLLLLAVLLVQLPVIGSTGDGPLGYGTAANPVEEVAAIDAAVGGDLAEQEVAEEAADTADERPVAFEQFAALTVSLGYESGQTQADDSWTAYSLHAPLTGMLAALLAIPLFAFAFARGVRWFGLVFLVPVGVLAPYTFLALANGTGAAVATLPLYAAAIFSLLVTRRDRGWWSLAMLFGAAIAVTGGALAILPLLITGIAWMFLRVTTYEHLAQADTPVGAVRALAPGVVGAGLAAYSLASTLASGELLAWPQLHGKVIDAVRSWPFAWLDTDLATTGPGGGVETAVWLAGPALLFIAAVHGVLRNERRELAVLIGAVASALIGLLVTFIERDAGIRLYEYSILAMSPLLAALAVRGVALAREHAEDAGDRGRIGRLAGWGPAVLIVGFVLVSLASTSVTGARMVHAPQLRSAVVEEGPALIAGGDQWLAFVLDGTRLAGSTDADVIATRDSESFPFAPWEVLVLPNSPLGSDPPTRFGEHDALDSYQARLFYDRQTHPTVEANQAPRTEIQLQRELRPAAEQVRKAEEGVTPREQQQEIDEAAPTELDFLLPSRHDPVEGSDIRTRPDQPAGLLVPYTDVPGCAIKKNDDPQACSPDEPVVPAECDDADVAAARSPIDPIRLKSSVIEGNSKIATNIGKDNGVLSIGGDADLDLRPPLLGVQCFDVEIDPGARVLQVHLRNIGLILAPEQATITGSRSSWSTSRQNRESGGAAGGVRRHTDALDSRIEYGGARLASGRFDIMAEGSFGAGVELTGGAFENSVLDDEGTVGQALSLGQLRGAADGFGAIFRDQALAGGTIALRNTSGTDVEFGRVFARPRDIPSSCDVVMGIETGERREMRIESDDANVTGKVQRPGFTVAIVEASGSGDNRTARVVVGNYLTFAGLPRFLMVDWTEQFNKPIESEGCDGVIREEFGTDPPGSGAPLATGDASKALGAPGN